MSIAMRFGSGGFANQNLIINEGGGGGPTGPTISYVTGNTLDDGSTTDIFTPEAGGVYMLFSVEWAHTSKTYRGGHIRYITAPHADKFGSEASQVGGIFGSSASGITITANNNSTVSIKQTSSTYDLKYAIYKVEFE